ncbi:membrane protein [Pseudonocardia sp. EC080610-09]|uniref:nicotinamide mononucleotide transporter family protein n=1 Tax=unclassified Pseudonocardia TaxID=2619320 RepID=UPI0006CB2519|nr:MULTISPECIES: nicotinamide mononucleotide transporter family protein [unclassified Pseudonocardia]ALE73144.1 membrane protein [Pseudonocardia sp. EC080625-04]ALL76467.1 membrane protein [Pseudonocardia sp. EC080610-09]ALL83493.1 membrane protein [Pseudonocardia sp. EC080619-01]
MDLLLHHGPTLFGQFVSWAEMIGQIGALAVVFLARRRSLATWPVQMAACALLFAVYASAHLGGLAFRQVIVFAISVFGLVAWMRQRDPVYGLAVRHGTWPQRLGLAGLLVGGTVAMALVLDALGASWAPWPDAAIFVGTAVAFLAQGLRLIEFWAIWLLVDAIGVPLQMASGLWFSAAVYVVFAGLVVHGWWSWARSRRTVDTAGREPSRAG